LRDSGVGSIAFEAIAFVIGDFNEVWQLVAVRVFCWWVVEEDR
jgi:hypothetical protein